VTQADQIVLEMEGEAVAVLLRQLVQIPTPLMMGSAPRVRRRSWRRSIVGHVGPRHNADRTASAASAGSDIMPPSSNTFSHASARATTAFPGPLVVAKIRDSVVSATPSASATSNAVPPSLARQGVQTRANSTPADPRWAEQLFNACTATRRAWERSAIVQHQRDRRLEHIGLALERTRGEQGVKGLTQGAELEIAHAANIGTAASLQNSAMRSLSRGGSDRSPTE
jgi:hypothetical protein